jgi:hypothetical protein
MSVSRIIALALQAAFKYLSSNPVVKEAWTKEVKESTTSPEIFQINGFHDDMMIVSIHLVQLASENKKMRKQQTNKQN